ncbi:hypothetical protein CFC21_112509, partial [Triticum aestivum]|nr:hypothetical protein [Triticum aestivum]
KEIKMMPFGAGRR